MSLHGILGGAIKGLDPEMLFDPFEKQFYLPSGAIKVSGKVKLLIREGDNLIALNAHGFVRRHRVKTFATEVGFCPRDKESRCPMYLVEPHEIDIITIHDDIHDDEDLSKIGIHPPIPVLIGMTHGIAENLATDAQMIQPGVVCPQAGLNIP